MEAKYKRWEYNHKDLNNIRTSYIKLQLKSGSWKYNPTADENFHSKYKSWKYDHNAVGKSTKLVRTSRSMEYIP